MGMKGTSNIVVNRTGSSLAPLCKRKRVTVIDFDSIRHDDLFRSDEIDEFLAQMFRNEACNSIMVIDS